MAAVKFGIVYFRWKKEDELRRWTRASAISCYRIQCNVMTHSVLSKGLFSRYQTLNKSQWRQWKQWNAIDEQHIIRFKNLDQKYLRIICLDVLAYGMISTCIVQIVYKLAYVLDVPKPLSEWNVCIEIMLSHKLEKKIATYSASYW